MGGFQSSKIDKGLVKRPTGVHSFVPRLILHLLFPVCEASAATDKAGRILTDHIRNVLA